MGVRLLDGFDAYGAVADLEGQWVATNSATGLSLVTGRAGDESISPGGQALQWASGQLTTEIKRTVGLSGDRVAPDIWIFGFNVKFASLPAADTRFLAIGGSGDDDAEGQLEITSSGTLKWVREVTNDVATTTGALTAGAWHHIELTVECEDQTSTSVLEIAIDGTNEDFGAPTQRLVGQGPITDFTFGPKTNSVGAFSLDDFYLIDTTDGVTPTTLRGESQISTLYPDGDGNTTAWSFTGGATRWESVDEGEGVSHDGNTSYVHSQTAGQQNLFTFGNLDAGIANVDVVAVNIVGTKNGLGGPGFHAVKRTATTTVVDTGEVQRATVGSYVTSQKVFETDGESNAWTPTNVNSSEFGVEVE